MGDRNDGAGFELGLHDEPNPLVREVVHADKKDERKRETFESSPKVRSRSPTWTWIRRGRRSCAGEGALERRRGAEGEGYQLRSENKEKDDDAAHLTLTLGELLFVNDDALQLFRLQGMRRVESSSYERME